MKYFFDTEFYENGILIDLISIGIVAEDGREYYAETLLAREHANKSNWLQQNVLPHLTGEEKGRGVILQEIVDFVGDSPEFWAYYAAYDWVALCQLFGTMIELPKGWPMYCRDIKQLCDSLGNPKLPEQGKGEHHALADARWNKKAYDFLQSL